MKTFLHEIKCAMLVMLSFYRGLCHLLSSDGAAFDDAMEYCDEQKWHEIGKQIHK